MWRCKHCKEEFSFQTTSEKANHSRWCEQNPKRGDTSGLKKAQEKLTEERLGALEAFTVTCSSCTIEFIVTERAKQFPKKEAYYCTRACANSVGGKMKAQALVKSGEAHYRTICFHHHAKRCVVCGEENIVAVHHIDEDHHNNDPKNLIPLCPTHHQYCHSQYAHLVQPIIDEYLLSKFGGP